MHAFAMISYQVQLIEAHHVSDRHKKMTACLKHYNRYVWCYKIMSS